MNNHGNYIVSLGKLCRWLGQQAEALGVEIYPGFAAAEVLYNEDGTVKGVATGDMGIGKDGKHKDSYTPGIELHAKYTLFAEGVRGSLTKQLMAQGSTCATASTRRSSASASRSCGRSTRPTSRQGLVVHSQSAGRCRTRTPLAARSCITLATTSGRHRLRRPARLREPRISSPFDEFQRFKTHPDVAKYLKGGKRLAYGARAINEGGLQSIPKLTFPGGALIGCSAGFVNAAAHQGQPQRDEDRHAGGRGGVRGAGRAARPAATS